MVQIVCFYFHSFIDFILYVFCILSCSCELQTLKTYHQYHTDCLAAEGKLKEVARLEERQTGKSADLGLGQSGGQRRSSVKKMERLLEKVRHYQCFFCF